MIRTFIAVELPDPIRAALDEAQQQLKRARFGVKVSWAKVENLHLTLQFLGDTGVSVVPRVSATLGEVAGRHAAFDVPVGGTGTFPDERRARVLWVGCRDEAGRL